MYHIRKVLPKASLVEIISEIHRVKKKVYVCGAELTEDLKVRHNCVMYACKESTGTFAKSKYICSNCRGIYNHIKKRLLMGIVGA